MSISLKAELETWAAALKAYDEQDLERSLELFSVSYIPHSRTCRVSFTPPEHRRFLKDPHQHGPHIRYHRRTRDCRRTFRRCNQPRHLPCDCVSNHLGSSQPLATIRCRVLMGSHAHMAPCVYVSLFTSLITPASRYFQCGVSNFLLARYDLALLNFEDAYLYLRGNEAMSVLTSLSCSKLITP